jgi:hypothetical protein
MTQDSFDANPQLMSELVLRIANPALSAPNLEWMTWIAENRSLVQILAYRHFQRHGGLMLPPLPEGLAALQTHDLALQAAHAGQRTYPVFALPNWRQMMGLAPANSPPSGGAPPQTPRGSGSGKGKGKEKLEGSPLSPPWGRKGGPNFGQMGGNPFGAPGDR